MLKVKLFAFIVLGVISTSCKDDENALKNLFDSIPANNLSLLFFWITPYFNMVDEF